MGTPAYAAVSLERLLDAGFDVVGAVTRPDKPRGRGRAVQPSAVKALATERGIPVLDPASPRDPEFVERLGQLEPDLGVVVAYGRILPPAVLDCPRLGCINAHGSLLPALRGAAPIERALLAGLSRTGVTIMRIDEGLDTGPMLLARELAIADDEDADSLRRRMADLSAELLVEAVSRLFADGLDEVAQTDEDATYAPPLDKAEAAIDWTKPAVEIERQVRTFRPRPGAFAMDGERRLKVLDARVDATGADEAAAGDGTPGAVTVDADSLVVACGQGRLRIVRVQPEGKRAMEVGPWLRGRRDGPPERLQNGAH